MTSPLLSLPGAVPSDAPDTGVAAHYGDPLREQRRLAEGQGFVDLSSRCRHGHRAGPAVLAALADQPARRQPAPGRGHHRSRPLAQRPRRARDGDRRRRHDDLDPRRAWYGTRAGRLPRLDALHAPRRGRRRDRRLGHRLAAGHRAARGPALSRVSARGRELFVPRANSAEIAKTLGAPAGVAAYEALRVAAGEPRLGIETDHRTIPHEVGFLSTAVHLDKGCYRGQETVARVYNLGRPPRRMVLLHLDGSRERLPAPGADIVRDGKSIGRLGTAVHHFELGPIALAVVKRSTPDGETVQVVDAEGDPMAASIEAIPGLSYDELELAPTRRPQLGAPRTGLGVATL